MTTTATGLRTEPVLPAPRGPLSAGLLAALTSEGCPSATSCITAASREWPRTGSGIPH
jgi:hypothetical protein